MRATVVVDSEADYKSWLDDMEKLNAPAPAAARQGRSGESAVPK